MKGMVLAAGLGSRLRPLSLLCPKAAMPFLNRPLIHYALELLEQAGVDEIVVNTHHLPDQIEATARAGTGARLHFSREEEILGTAGALGKARDHFHDTFLVCNAKIYFEQALEEAVRFHRERKASVTLVLVPAREGQDRFNPVHLDDGGRIARFGRSPQAGGGYVFTGVHVLEPHVFDFIPEGGSETVNDVYPRMMQAGLTLLGFVSDRYWCECSTPQRYLRRSVEVMRRRALTNLAHCPLPPRSRGVVAGRRVRVAASARLENAVLWEGASVGEDSSLRNVILAENAEIAPQTRLQDAVVTPLLEHLTEQKGFTRIKDVLIWPL